MFTENKITEFEKRVSDLADRPKISAQALKAYFDASAEELRVKHNALIDALSAFAGNSFSAVSYNAADGKLQFTFGDGSVQVIDLPLELLIKSGDYDAETQSIMLTLANGDKIVIPVAALVDTYTADNQTLVCDNNTFSVKDGVFVLEAPKDGKNYARKDGAWTEVEKELPEIALGDADNIYEGVYRVKKQRYDDWVYGLLCASYNIYVYDCADIGAVQTILWSDGKIEHRERVDYVMGPEDVVQNPDGTYKPRPGYVFDEPWSAWKSVLPNLANYATKASVTAEIAAAKDAVTKNEFELIASGETTEEVNSIVVTADNDGNPFELCDMVTIYAQCPKASANSSLAINFENAIVHQTATTAINTNYIQYIIVHGIYTGKCWSGYSVANAGGVSGVQGEPKKRVCTKKTVNEIKMYLYDSDLALPVGFKYEIYGRRV